MTYQDQIIRKLQSEGFGFFSDEGMQALARFIEREVAPLKAEIMDARAKVITWDKITVMFSENATAKHVIGYLEQNGYTLIK